MNARYIPQDELTHLTDNLHLSRIESLRGWNQSTSHNNIPSSEDPFNRVLNYDVQYTEPRLSQTNRVLTKYENHAGFSNNIALYNTRTHALNAEDVEGLENVKLYRDQMERARSKVQQAHTDLLTHHNTSPIYNGNIYNPQLPISPTNQPTPADVSNSLSNTLNAYGQADTSTAGIRPAQPDERITYHTNERPFAYPSDMANQAYNLQRSPDIIERNRRQAEADDALYNRHAKSRWVEPKMAYHDRPYNPTYDLNEYIKRDSSKQNDRATKNIEKMTQTTVTRSKQVRNPESVNKIRSEINQTWQPYYARHAAYNNMKNINDRRDVKSNINHPANETFEPKSSRSLVERFASSIVNTVAEFVTSITRGRVESVDTRAQTINTVDSRPTTSVNTENVGKKIDLLNANAERFIYKPKHLYVVKNGQMREVYPDENFDNTGGVFINTDPLGTGLVRTIVIRDGPKYRIIQKLNEDSIFSGDNRRVGDDYIVYDIPVDHINTAVRDKIDKINLKSGRSKTLELTYTDFIGFSDLVSERPETGFRVKFKDLWQYVRGNTFDEDLVSSFDSQTTFVEPSVIQLAQAEERKRVHRQINQGRVDKDTSNAPDYVAPYSSPLASSSQQESFRHPQQSNTITPRAGGAKLRQFNS